MQNSFLTIDDFNWQIYWRHISVIITWLVLWMGVTLRSQSKNFTDEKNRWKKLKDFYMKIKKLFASIFLPQLFFWKNNPETIYLKVEVFLIKRWHGITLCNYFCLSHRIMVGVKKRPPLSDSSYGNNFIELGRIMVQCYYQDLFEEVSLFFPTG